MKRFFMNILILISSFMYTSCCYRFEQNSDQTLSFSDMSNYTETDSTYEYAYKKIWIIKNTSNFTPSIYITKIENGIIEGKWSLKLITPDCYTTSFESQKYGTFKGIIVDGLAKCDFTDESGDGTLDLVFNGDDAISASIQFSNKKYSDKEYPEGNHVFEPYTISDYGMPDDINCYFISLNSWGNVFLKTGYVTAHHPYAVAYLTDENDNILYEFKGLSNGWQISEVLIEDMNNDGLKDIKIILDTPMIGMEYIFIQMEDGLFYDSRLNSNLNISE